MRTAEQLRYLILAAQREGNRQLTTLLSEIDLTPAQSEALRIIADYGPLALKELGDMLVCDSGTNPSRIVGRLVDAGLVQRAAGEHDRRQIQLTATRQGLERTAQVQGIEHRLYNAIDGVLDPADTQVFLRALRALTKDSPAGAALGHRIAAEHSRSDRTWRQ